MLQLKLVGEGDSTEYEKLGIPIINRLLHVPENNHRYIKGTPTIPEVRICLDFLGKPSIDWDGKMYICNRFDKEGLAYLGNLNFESLDYLWNSPRRMQWLDAHIRGKREEAAPICRTCEYWGVPSGANG